MNGESNLKILMKNMTPFLNEGDYVFCAIETPDSIDLSNALCFFRELEAYTVIIEKSLADEQGLAYSFVAAWITLTIHSSLDAVGFTAAFSKLLADNGIGCNVVAAFYHDHLFVSRKDAARAMEVLNSVPGS